MTGRTEPEALTAFSKRVTTGVPTGYMKRCSPSRPQSTRSLVRQHVSHLMQFSKFTTT